jgi:hypothetical protein
MARGAASLSFKLLDGKAKPFRPSGGKAAKSAGFKFMKNQTKFIGKNPVICVYYENE